MNGLICADCGDILPAIPDDSVDLILTDPPYGIGFMGRDWDRAVPSVDIWRECLRVLKPGAFAFVMSIPRMDCLSQMGARLAEAGFETGFTPIFWAYASGFPKAANMGKLVDKRLGAEREVVGEYAWPDGGQRDTATHQTKWHGIYHDIKGDDSPNDRSLTAPATLQAQALDGSYAGFQPKPAVEVIVVAMKPLEHGTYVDQALDNGKGVTWLDDCRVPIAQGEQGYTINTWDDGSKPFGNGAGHPYTTRFDIKARFPANLLVSDDVLNDGLSRHARGNKSHEIRTMRGGWYGNTWNEGRQSPGRPYDSGSFSRYFSLDSWFQAKLSRFPESVQRTFPFLVVPKAGKKEKNLGCEGLPEQDIAYSGYRKNYDTTSSWVAEYPDGKPRPMNKFRNNHPCVKPLKLMSYLITLGSRPGGLVVDPFAGTCTTGMAAKALGRDWLMIEREEKWCQIGRRRVDAVEAKLF